MLSMLFGAALVAVGLPVLMIVCFCVAGSRLIRATEMSDGDCARSLAREAPRRPVDVRSPRLAKALWQAEDGRRIDILAN